MSDALHHEPEYDVWTPPATFREGLASTEHVAAALLDQIEGQLLVPVADIEFMIRRLHVLTRASHRALPPEVD